MGLLADIFSASDTAKRRLRGLLDDPAGTLGLGATRAVEDQAGLLGLMDQAGVTPGSNSVLLDNKKRAAQQLADKALESFGGLLGATVWHGSPHKFDKFDSSKIGTGEGKQQQGIGAYLAESPAVGQKYADKESWKRGMDSGYLYKVDVPDDLIGSMANHDLPMSQQPDAVKSIIGRLLNADAKQSLKDYHGWDDVNDAPFAAVMNALEISKGNNRAATSEALRQAGIPGIRYLDGGSRGAGQGTSNFVVFPGNEGLLQILERNGQPIK